MISIIVVVLVGIGFTRLTMLALEMRDSDNELYETAPAETLLRKEIISARMRLMVKPAVLIVTGEDQCRIPKDDVACNPTPFDTECCEFPNSGGKTIAFHSDLDLSCDKLGGEETKNCGDFIESGFTRDQSDPSSLHDESHSDLNEIVVDANSLCIICFERIKNSVFLKCGHGGVCYACALDTCVVSGKCPLCRSPISQIVITEEKGTLSNESDDKITNSPRTVRVVGPN